jgi:hypothetical protein
MIKKKTWAHGNFHAPVIFPAYAVSSDSGFKRAVCTSDSRGLCTAVVDHRVHITSGSHPTASDIPEAYARV